MKALKVLLILLVVAFIAIQFVPRKLPENKPEDEKDILKSGIVNADVQTIFKTSCYDCHSNQTSFPWYARIAPTSWMLADHINEGREHLNFSEWGGYNKRKQLGIIEDIQEEVESGGMPLKSYLLIHRDAKITADEKAKIDAWTDSASERILE